MIYVVDTETTGLGETDQVIELAVVEVPGHRRLDTLIRPTVPVSVEARAAHHISDALLTGLQTLPEIVDVVARAERPLESVGELAVSWLAEGSAGGYLAAHNAEFDRRMLIQSGVQLLPPKTICTYRCALHLFPEAPSFSNQVLRYYLDLGVDAGDLPPHRALPDALVTAAVLAEMLKLKTPDELVELTTSPVLLRTVRFGQNRGVAWSKMDDGFLRWVLKNFNAATQSDELHTAAYWLTERGRHVPARA